MQVLIIPPSNLPSGPPLRPNSPLMIGLSSSLEFLNEVVHHLILTLNIPAYELNQACEVEPTRSLVKGVISPPTIGDGPGAGESTRDCDPLLTRPSINVLAIFSVNSS
jgi:hypothetical protein